MTREESLAVWAPHDSPWSPWTKSVLFSFLSEEVPDLFAAPAGLRRRADLLKDTALVVEMPGSEGVELGITLARSGYRPIPLYNACAYSPLHEPRRNNTPSAVDVTPILRAIETETATLRSIPLPPTAPPAFLLDANRLGSWFSPPEGWFDNRSVVRETDAPSARFLRSQGIRQVVVIRPGTNLPRDLRVVLQAWQEGGLILSTQTPSGRWDPQLLTLPRPSWLAMWWDQTLVALRCRPRPDGFFGRMVSTAG